MKPIIRDKLFLSFIAFLLSFPAFSQKKAQEYYQIKVYHFSTSPQEKILDDFLARAFLPSLHKNGIRQVGVFKPLANDTASAKKIYVFAAASSLEKLAALPAQLQKDSAYSKSAQDYLQAVYNQPPFSRIETIYLKAFRMAPKMKLPGLRNERKERVYELRSYEGATEKLYNSKVKMFNEGGEIVLFNRLGFNAVFYAEVLSGSRMPNLMYMTSFENMTERDAHWDAFRADAEWKRISALPEYQRNVSRAEIILLRATDYSDF